MSGGTELPVEIDRLAREFIARERAGEQPTISEYVQRYPEYESGIREVFPMLAVMEGVKPPTGSGSPAGAKALDPDVRTLGDYKLERVVGRGGMGVVYEAVQADLGRRVALKVLPPAATVDPRFVERFRIEAQAAAGLQHPNIVPVIGLGEDEGVHYYAMQFIDGCGLDEVLDDARALLDGSSDDAAQSGSGAAARLFAVNLESGSSAVGSESSVASPAPAPVASPVQPTSRAGRRRYRHNVARIGLQAAEALAFAHARGVLHRDIKPSNIMLDERGRAWITDFGLCRQEESGGLTETGDLVGTLRYMAPESFSGVHDVRGDVYGLGLTLYELLCAAPAYDDTNRMELIRKVTQESPPKLRSRDPSIPEDLATIVHKAIAHDPAMRYQTAEALVADLRAYLDGRPISARAPSLAYVLRAAIRRHRPLAVTILASIVLLVAGTVFYVLSVKDKEEQARLEHYAANVAAAETALRDGDLPRARRLLARAPEEFRGWEWRHLQSRLEPGVRTFQSMSPHTAQVVAHSPDGKLLAVSGSKHICVYDHLSGELLRKLDKPAWALAWSPDSSRLAALNGNDLRVFAWPSGNEVKHHWSPEWQRDLCYDPTGSWLYVGTEHCQVHVRDARTLRELANVTVESKVWSVAVDRTGKHLAIGRLDGKVSLVDTEDWRILWTQRASARGVLSVDFVDSRFVAASAMEGSAHVFRVPDGSLLRVLSHTESVWELAASPVAPLLASVHGQGQVSLWNVETGQRPDPWNHGRIATAVSFHPDGQRFVSASHAGTIREWSALAGGDVRMFRTEVDSVLAVATQPGGTLVASGELGGIVRLHDRHTSQLVRAWPQHAGRVMAVAFSPDGGYLASAGSDASIHIRRLADDKIVQRMRGHTRPIRELAFLPGGRRLLSVAEDGTLRVWDPQAGTEVKQLELSKARLFALAVSRRGLIAVGGESKEVVLVDASSWSVRRRLAGHEAYVRGLDFHPSGDVLASGSADQTVRMWDTASGKMLRVLSQPEPDLGQHTEVVQCVAFHPDGRRLATASRNASISIWDWERGQSLSTLSLHEGWVHAIAFSRDGEVLVSCSSDRTVRLTGVRSLAQRVTSQEQAWAARKKMEPLVERLHEELGSLERVIARIPEEPGLQAAEREAALRLAHARRATLSELKGWAWRVLARPDAEPDEQARVLALSEALLRFADLRALHHPESYILTGAAKYRLGKRPVKGYMDRALTMEAPPDVHAKAMAFLSLRHTQQNNLKQGGYWLIRLKSHLTLHPEAQTVSVKALHDEAFSVFKAKRDG